MKNPSDSSGSREAASLLRSTGQATIWDATLRYLEARFLLARDWEVGATALYNAACDAAAEAEAVQALREWAQP